MAGVPLAAAAAAPVAPPRPRPAPLRPQLLLRRRPQSRLRGRREQERRERARGDRGVITGKQSTHRPRSLRSPHRNRRPWLVRRALVRVTGRDGQSTSYPVKRHRGEPGHTRDTRDTRAHAGTRITRYLSSEPPQMTSTSELFLRVVVGTWKQLKSKLNVEC